MLSALERHPHAHAVLAPALAPAGEPSHAYLFHGPEGSGKRQAARELAIVLLSEGAADPPGARARVQSGAHPDLTWVVPSGAHELLVSDIDEPVVAAASRTPFEASRRVFVIERADELGEEAANRMLKTLEEPASYVHLVLLTDRPEDVLPTIRSRCQLVRFDAPPAAEVAQELEDAGLEPDTARACARLSLASSEQARELAGGQGQALRAAAEAFARAVLEGSAATARPWRELLEAVGGRGEAVQAELEARAEAELQLHPRKERKRVESAWNERIRRVRRRTETAELDLGLQLVSLWFADLAALEWGADDLVRNVDRLPQLREQAAPDPQQLRRAIEHVEDTRQRFQLNVSADLACEALAYRLEQALAG